jgi:hypothetical protein
MRRIFRKVAENLPADEASELGNWGAYEYLTGSGGSRADHHHQTLKK